MDSSIVSHRVACGTATLRRYSQSEATTAWMLMMIYKP